MASSDIQITTDAFLQFGGSIFSQALLKWNLANQGIQIRTNVNAPQSLTKLSSRGAPRPYRSNDDKDSQGAVYSDRILTAYMAKWDFPFDFEDFRNTYLADPAMKDKMMYEGALAFLSEKFLEHLNTSTIYSGIRDGAGDAPEDVCNGWGTIIDAEITLATITAVATGALTNANAVTKVELLTNDASFPIKMKEMGFIVYCSYATARKYAQHYRTLNNINFRPNEVGDYPLDNENAVLRPVSWMGTSGRLIATVKNNLVFGTDTNQVSVYPTPRYNIIDTRLMMPVGCEINDLDLLMVNDQS